MRWFSSAEEWKATGAKLLSLFSILFGLALAREFAHYLSAGSGEGLFSWLNEEVVLWTVSLLVFCACIWLRRVALTPSDPRPKFQLNLVKLLFSMPKGIRAIQLIAIGCAGLAITSDLSTGLYAVLHAVAFMSSLICVLVMNRREHIVWTFIIALVALIYCPLVHLGLEEEQWKILDGVTTGVLSAVFCASVTRRESERGGDAIS